MRRSVAYRDAVGDRHATAIALAELAGIEAARGETQLAGQLWGAVEAESERRTLRFWEAGYREEMAEQVLVAAGPQFERGVSQGRALTLDAAVQLALRGKTQLPDEEPPERFWKEEMPSADL
jgi:hypothetical protein